jgi:Cu/Ag efflux pump CusA
MSFWQELGLEMSIASNYLYLMFKEIGNGGGTYIFALMASFVLSLVVSAAIWAYYTRNRKKEDQEIYA